MLRCIPRTHVSSRMHRASRGGATGTHPPSTNPSHRATAKVFKQCTASLWDARKCFNLLVVPIGA